MSKHPKLKRISHEEMTSNQQTFYYVNSLFKNDALRPYGIVIEVGRAQRAPLHVAVEWDSKTVLLGYSRHGGAFTRIQMGLEEWFHPSEYFPVHYHRQPYDPVEYHSVILAFAQAAQKILDEIPDGEKVAEEKKSDIRKIIKASLDNPENLDESF